MGPLFRDFTRENPVWKIFGQKNAASGKLLPKAAPTSIYQLSVFRGVRPRSAIGPAGDGSAQFRAPRAPRGVSVVPLDQRARAVPRKNHQLARFITRPRRISGKRSTQVSDRRPNTSALGDPFAGVVRPAIKDLQFIGGGSAGVRPALQNRIGDIFPSGPDAVGHGDVRHHRAVDGRRRLRAQHPHRRVTVRHFEFKGRIFQINVDDVNPLRPASQRVVTDLIIDQARDEGGGGDCFSATP